MPEANSSCSLRWFLPSRPLLVRRRTRVSPLIRPRRYCARNLWARPVYFHPVKSKSALPDCLPASSLAELAARALRKAQSLDGCQFHSRSQRLFPAPERPDYRFEIFAPLRERTSESSAILAGQLRPASKEYSSGPDFSPHSRLPERRCREARVLSRAERIQWEAIPAAPSAARPPTRRYSEAAARFSEGGVAHRAR